MIKDVHHNCCCFQQAGWIVGAYVAVLDNSLAKTLNHGVEAHPLPQTITIRKFKLDDPSPNPSKPLHEPHRFSFFGK